MSIGRIILAIVAMLLVAALVYSGLWHVVTLFVWQHPMLTWLPILALVLIGFGVGAIGSLTAAGGRPVTAPAAPSTEIGKPSEAVGSGVSPQVATDSGSGYRFRWGLGLLGAIAVILIGVWFTWISPPMVDLDKISYEVVDSLPERTQPRLLPRAGVDDDPSFADAKEIHLARDPKTGELMWTGEWQAGFFGGPSSGVAVKRLDDVIAQSEIVRAGFDESVAGIRPNTLKGTAYRKHPFSKIQYPVLIPTGEREAIAIAPYIGYEGFPFKTPYVKGVLVYHQDGTLEDLTPEEAAARPELANTGRLFPETVAREQAEALAEEFDGEIVDGEDNRQPYLTALDRGETAWVTVINHSERSGGVKAIVLADSSTGETEVWQPPEGTTMVSTRDVLDEARALPLRWEETRCCDSDGHSYEVTLREVVEPRLVFKGGKPYYMVSVVPTDDLAIAREIEYTLLIDAETGEKIGQFDHVGGGPGEDARLQRFFR
jgi:hypothetical protein